MTTRNTIRLVVGLLILLIVTGITTWKIHIYLQQEKLNTTLISAIEYHDTRAMQVLLLQGADPNARCKDKSANFFEFCKQSYSLYKSKPELNATALLVAVGRGNLASVKMLVYAGADVNACEEYNYTPILSAAAHDREESVSIIRFLAEHGANVEAKLDDGTTAWDLAALEPKTIKALNEAAVLQRGFGSRRTGAGPLIGVTTPTGTGGQTSDTESRPTVKFRP